MLISLLELLEIKGAIVTIDAMGTQTEIVRQIQEKKADYVLALKANHPTLYSQVKNWFNAAKMTQFKGLNSVMNKRNTQNQKARFYKGFSECFFRVILVKLFRI